MKPCRHSSHRACSSAFRRFRSRRLESPHKNKNGRTLPTRSQIQNPTVPPRGTPRLRALSSPPRSSPCTHSVHTGTRYNTIKSPFLISSPLISASLPSLSSIPVSHLSRFSFFPSVLSARSVSILERSKPVPCSASSAYSAIKNLANQKRNKTGTKSKQNRNALLSICAPGCVTETKSKRKRNEIETKPERFRNTGTISCGTPCKHAPPFRKKIASTISSTSVTFFLKDPGQPVRNLNQHRKGN